MKKTICEKILDHDFHCSVVYDYDRSQCDGECQDYCRCSIIENKEVKSVDIKDISEEIFNILKKANKEIDLNSIIYLCDHFNINSENFHIETIGGYYGEELNGIYLQGKNAHEFAEFIQKLCEEL